MYLEVKSFLLTSIIDGVIDGQITIIYYGALQPADIDECEDQSLCHKCQNTIGSYICLCNEGYTNRTVDGTSLSCEGGYCFKLILAPCIMY